MSNLRTTSFFQLFLQKHESKVIRSIIPYERPICLPSMQPHTFSMYPVAEHTIP